MKLSEIAADLQIDVVQDGEFFSVGPIHRDTESLLTFAKDDAFLEKALNKLNVACLVAGDGVEVPVIAAEIYNAPVEDGMGPDPASGIEQRGDVFFVPGAAPG